MSVSIRNAVTDDASALAALWRQLDTLHATLHPTFFRSPAAPRSHNEISKRLSDPNGQVFVACVSDRVVGAISVRIYETPNDPGIVSARRAYFDDLIVDRDRQRQGIGRALFTAARHWACARGATQLLLTLWDGNDSGAKFYEALGFQCVNRVLSASAEPRCGNS